MKLEEFKEISDFDGEIDKLRNTAMQTEREAAGALPYARISLPKESAYGIVDKFRSSFRRKIRKLADSSSSFSSTRNGRGSFRGWRDGFEFAVSLGNHFEIVKYINFSGTPAASFFHKEHTLNNMNKIMQEFQLLSLPVFRARACPEAKLVLLSQLASRVLLFFLKSQTFWYYLVKFGSQKPKVSVL
jgi:hypothetical protein